MLGVEEQQQEAQQGASCAKQPAEGDRSLRPLGFSAPLRVEALAEGLDHFSGFPFPQPQRLDPSRLTQLDQ